MALDDRKAAILRALVEEYIDTGQPVGSGHVAKAPEVNVSSATVRNDMAALEADGFLRQPHTSAGRVPTEKGYRFFVDHLERPTGLAGNQAEQVRTFFDRAHGRLELMLQQTSHLLSELTQHTAVVVAPDVEAATIVSAQVVSLGPRVVLVLVVLSNGAVHKETIETAFDVSVMQCEAASSELSRVLTGHTLADPLPALKIEDRSVAKLATLALTAFAPDTEGSDHIYVDGASRVASAFDAVDTVSEVLTILEQQLIVVTLLRDVLDRGLSVAIGSETGFEPLSEAALVVAPYRIEGETAGSVGVLGPARMDYPQALAAVAVVSKRLSDRLSEG
jgi:heat-inducible transcriptional repressor